MISLYKHQYELVEKARETLRAGIKRFIMVASTGFGKTRVACNIIESLLKNNKTIVVLCNRDKLVRQWDEVLTGFNIDHGIIQQNENHPNKKIYIASVDSYITRLDDYALFDYVFSDECHFALGNNYRSCIEHNKNAVSIGMTATPIAPNGTGFHGLYDAIIEAKSMKWLIDNKYLSRLHIYSPSPPSIDLDIIDGDFNMAQYMRKSGGIKRISNAIELYKKYANGKLTILFAVNIKDAKIISKQFNDSGIPSECIHSNLSTKTQNKILQDFKDKKFLVLTSVSILNEGIDVKEIECGIDMSPTASLTRFIQRWGRCVRIAEGKEHAVMLDLSGNFWLHREPWADRQWTLGDNKPTKQSIQDRITSACICQICGRNYDSSENSCPYCGSGKQNRKRAIKQATGELILVTEQEYQQEMQRRKEEQERKAQAEKEEEERKAEYHRRRKQAKTLEDYQQIEHDLNLKSGWAYVNYQQYLRARQKYFK